MNKKIAQVLTGFKNLSQEDKKEFLKHAKTLMEGYSWDKDKLNESIKGFSLGPKTDSCQCCGK